MRRAWLAPYRAGRDPAGRQWAGTGLQAVTGHCSPLLRSGSESKHPIARSGHQERAQAWYTHRNLITVAPFRARGLNKAGDDTEIRLAAPVSAGQQRDQCGNAIRTRRSRRGSREELALFFVRTTSLPARGGLCPLKHRGSCGVWCTPVGPGKSEGNSVVFVSRRAWHRHRNLITVAP